MTRPEGFEIEPRIYPRIQVATRKESVFQHSYDLWMYNPTKAITGEGCSCVEVVVAITRFAGLGGQAETLPWGPTVPEMAAFMRSLGCVRAVLLDGGISSQLAVRDVDGEVARWANWRKLPLGLVVTPRRGARASMTGAR